jgi:putative membrane protein
VSEEDTQAPDRRTVLAADRTVYAAERTYAAWMRTGLTALASGIGAKALLAEVVPEFLIVTTGTILVLFSAFCFTVAVIREFRPGPPPPEPDVRKIPSAVLLVVSGFLVIVSLAALVGVWFGRSGAISH